MRNFYATFDVPFLTGEVFGAYHPPFSQVAITGLLSFLFPEVFGFLAGGETRTKNNELFHFSAYPLISASI